MRQFCLLLAGVLIVSAPAVQAQDGPYKVLKTARVGGEGGWDYIFADAAGRRLYIPRGATRAVAATDTSSRSAGRRGAADNLRSRHAEAGR